MKDFAFKNSDYSKYIFSLILFIFILSMYIGLEIFFQKLSYDIVNSWYSTEYVNLQQGNTLTAVTKLQRVISPSSVLKGVAVFDDSNNTLLNIGEIIAPQSQQQEFLDTIQSEKSYLFRNSYFLKSNNLRIVLSTSSNMLVYIFIGIALYSVLVLTAIEIVTRKFTIKIEKINSFNALNELRLESQFNETLAKIATSVAHDIRSPISALNLITSTIKGSPEHHELLRTSIDRITAIANSILDYNRTIKTEPKIFIRENLGQKKTDIVEIVKSIVSEKSLLLNDDRITLTFESEEFDKILVTVGETDLYRGISNVVNNAIESIQTSGRVSVRTHSTASKATISIFDNGKGIPAEILSRVGTHGFTNGKKDGNGIGLHSTIQMVESYGGKVTINSRFNEGTLVSLEFPKQSS